jgi:hypothetical protein
MYCDENLTCQLTQPLCGAECKVVEDCPMVRVCIECGDGCAAQACVDGACVFDCPDPPDDPCGGCAAGEVCIYQAGGPGPSRYTCAMEKPCASPVACACIVGQGECMFREATADDPGICVCDNGLE